jgi:NADPH:quinone reductase-like Zn-dependent oxidoreductase
MAKSLGSRVFTTAGSGENCAACQRLGAYVAVNYHEQDYVKVLKEATDGQGVDVILDIVGGDYVARNPELAAKDGRIVSLSFIKGSRVEIDMMHIWPLIESRVIKPLIAARFPLADASESHKLMESSKHIGKIIL